MTKERKLAIEMWESVKAYIVDADKKCELYDCIHDAVIMIKGDFCEKHGLQWAVDCWFCQYISACDRCPLGMCGHRTDCEDYYIVLDDFTTTEQKIKACDNIINALKGKPSTQEES